MENNKEFRSVVENIKQLEQQLLLSVDCKRYEQEGEEMEKEIEEHFARCMNSLAARKEALLRELNKHISDKSMLSHISLISLFFSSLLSHITFSSWSFPFIK